MRSLPWSLVVDSGVAQCTTYCLKNLGVGGGSGGFPTNCGNVSNIILFGSSPLGWRISSIFLEVGRAVSLRLSKPLLTSFHRAGAPAAFVACREVI